MITEKECVQDRNPDSKAKIRLVQHRAAISATAELLFMYHSQSVVFFLFLPNNEGTQCRRKVMFILCMQYLFTIKTITNI